MEVNPGSRYRDFEVLYKGNRILVRNEAQEGERLFINGVLQDQNMGPNNGTLIASLYSGNTITDRIEVHLKNGKELECAIYVNDEIIYSNVYSQELEEKKRSSQKVTQQISKRVNRRMLLFLAVISIFIVMLKLFASFGII